LLLHPKTYNPAILFPFLKLRLHDTTHIAYSFFPTMYLWQCIHAHCTSEIPTFYYRFIVVRIGTKAPNDCTRGSQ
jgi:hypothetical protein